MARLNAPKGTCPFCLNNVSTTNSRAIHPHKCSTPLMKTPHYCPGAWQTALEYSDEGASYIRLYYRMLITSQITLIHIYYESVEEYRGIKGTSKLARRAIRSAVSCEKQLKLATESLVAYELAYFQRGIQTEEAIASYQKKLSELQCKKIALTNECKRTYAVQHEIDYVERMLSGLVVDIQN